MTDFYAHSGNKADRSDWQLLRDHLRHVAELARRFAVEAGPKDDALAAAAHVAGLLHDLGKYREGFQQMLLGGPKGPLSHHKQFGAACGYRGKHPPLAFVIQGHHGGMPDKAELQGACMSPEHLKVLNELLPVASNELPELARLTFAMPKLREATHFDLFTRLLFSCLIDADWTDTGTHERSVNGCPSDPDPPPLVPALRLARLREYIASRAAACKQPTVARLRHSVLEACLQAALEPPGLRSLTVPTGGGKTLSALAFALRHAEAHGLRRIIYVAPYLTILEQNAGAIRAALGLTHDASDLFEHHSLSDPGAAKQRVDASQQENETAIEAAARNAERWDAPIIVTTNVQFFESLFSNQPSRCRKLHNMARSVILLDECQALPPDLVGPTCGMLKQIAEQLGSTIVLCTATQPAFDHPELGDLELLFKAVEGPMWEIDRSASRGLMSTRGLYVFEHSSMLGDAPAHELFARIEVPPLGADKAPRRFADYKVDVKTDGLPAGVKLHRRVG